MITRQQWTRHEWYMTQTERSTAARFQTHKFPHCRKLDFDMIWTGRYKGMCFVQQKHSWVIQAYYAAWLQQLIEEKIFPIFSSVWNVAERFYMTQDKSFCKVRGALSKMVRFPCSFSFYFRDFISETTLFTL